MRILCFLELISCYVLLVFDMVNSFRCDRKPYGSTFQSSPSDGRFKLTVLGVDDNAYIPDQIYNVQLKATDDESHFTGFMISVEGDAKQDPHNPRRIITLYPGEVRPINPTTAKFSERCPYSVEHAMGSIKSSAEVNWQAPQSGNGCVTVRAVVVENDESWFEDGAPLTQKICEALRQPDDIAPRINYECEICDEAKYEIAFTGVWSKNTHPRFYPENDWVPKYSALVGASHSADYILWTPGSIASDGLKELAEHANTSKFEEEIREKIGDGVRTMIKGKGHGFRKMGDPIYSFFRTDKENHIFTVALGIYPSPDWFLGVTRFELCQDNEWLPERELNLFPWDAGTDGGISYESPNMATVPQEPIVRVQMSSYDKNSPFYGMNMKDMHPFGKVTIKLIRTYHRDCEETTEDPRQEGEKETHEEESKEKETNTKQPEPEEPSRYQNPEVDSGVFGGRPTEDTPVISVSEPAANCPMSQWAEWSACEGSCEDGKIKGYKWRERYHLVDGVAVEKYDPNARFSHKKEVSKYCKSQVDDFERDDCEENCLELPSEGENAERRVMGRFKQTFTYSKKRDLNKIKNKFLF